MRSRDDVDELELFLAERGAPLLRTAKLLAGSRGGRRGPANVAELHVTIPSGFTEVPAPPPGSVGRAA